MVDALEWGPDAPLIRLLGWFNDLITDDKWASFAALPSSSSSSSSGPNVLDAEVSRWVELIRAAKENANSRGRSASGSIPSPRDTAPPRTRSQCMERAQALAEAGRFEMAGKMIDDWLGQAQAALAGGAMEEIELWQVAGAFYEAAGTSFLAYQKCLREAAQLCVTTERWATAADLFETGALAWTEQTNNSDASR